MYIQGYTSQNEYFEYDYPNSDALLQFCLKFEHCNLHLHKAARHPTKCDIIISDSISQDILLQIFYVIQSDFELQKHVH